MTLLAISFIIVLSFSVNPAAAAPQCKPERQPWLEGNQIPDLATVPEAIPRKNSVIVKGTKMLCLEGYVFGEIVVAYEIIDWMIIFASPEELYQDQMLGYTARRVGRFTWYDPAGKRVAEGGFVFSSKEQMGYLWAKGPGLFVKGTFWLKPPSDWETIEGPKGPILLPTIGHAGWYILTGK